MTNSHTERIRELFIKLREGNKWYMRHHEDAEKVNELMIRSEPIFDELDKLGVERTFSQSLLIFGTAFIEDLVVQFEKKE